MHVKHYYAVPEIDSDFQAVIRAERARRRMNRTVFARMIGVSRQSLIAYEEDGQAPKLALAASIAQRLGMTLDELAGIRERPAAADPPPPSVVVNGVEYAPVSALDAGAASRREAEAALEEAEEVALDAEAAAQRGHEKDVPKRRRSAG